MAELATPTRYNVPVMTQNFQPTQIAPMAVDARGLAKAQMWGEIAKSIATLPDTLIKSYQLARQRKKDETEEKNQALIQQKFQEATTPSAVAVDSPANKALGVIPGTQGGGVNKPSLSDFDLTPSGMTYRPEDPALKKAKVDYYESQALANSLKDFGKNDGVTYPSVQAAKDAGVDPEGAELHADGTVTVKKYKPGGLDAKGRAKLTDSQRTKLDSAAQLADSMDGILEDYDILASKHMAGPVMGNLEKLKQRFGMGSEEGSRVNAEMNAQLFRIARMLNGAGVLTDSDIKRAEGVAPTVTMGREQFLGQLNAVKAEVKGGLERWKQINATTATDEQLALADRAIASLSKGASVAAPAGVTPPAATPPVAPGAAPTSTITTPPTAPVAETPTVGHMSAQDSAAVAWIHNHPNDPRAAKIKQVLAAKGIAIN